MANAIGASLGIPQSVLNKLDEVDKKINLISSDSEKMVTHFTSAMTRMDKSIDPVLDKISMLQTNIANIDFSKIGNNLSRGLDNTSKKAEEAVNNIAKVTSELSKSQKPQRESAPSQYMEYSRQIAEAQKQMEILVRSTKEYELTLNRLKDGKGGVLLAGSKEEYDNNMKNITALNSQIKLLQDKQNALVQNVQLERQQEQIVAGLRSYASDKNSLPEQRKNEELRRMNEYYKQEAINSAKSAEGALSMENKSIAQRIAQNKQLVIARNNLEKGTASYEATLAKLNNQILQNNRANAQAIAGSKEAQKQQRSLIDTSSQLQSKLAMLFSVSKITGYVNKMIAVRAELELQQRALQAIIQCKDEADRIFKKVTDLAVKSPYQVRQLVTYTKQLAAYRIESSKLYDTTKMLADVASGLGVDMQRIILAYGQVKAANYLRGTELRQFSEAGINMLGELSAYFTELKGQAVSTGDVFEMISNRLVSFNDVAEVFKRLTQEGGLFYNMQEIQAETLRGQISNLRDELDLMFNKIGKSNDGVLKNVVKTSKVLIRNWEYFVPVIKAIVAALVLNRVILLSTSDALIKYAVANNIANTTNAKSLTLTNLLTIAWKKFTLAIKRAAVATKSFAMTNPMATTFLIAASALYKLYDVVSDHSKQLDDISKKYKELRDTVNEINVKFDFAVSTENIDEQKKELIKLVKIANEEYQMNIKISYEDMTPEDVVKSYKDIKDNIDLINRGAEDFEKTMELASHWTIQDDIYEDFGDLGKSLKKMDEYVFKSKTDIVNNLIAMKDSLTDTQKEALKLLETPRQSDQTKEGYETELDYLFKMQKAYDMLYEDSRKGYEEASKRGAAAQELNAELVKSAKTLERIGLSPRYFKISANIQSDLAEATKEFENFARNWNVPSGTSQENKTLMIKTAIDKIALNKEMDDFQKEMMYRLANMRFNVNIGYSIIQNDQLTGFEKEFQDYLDSANFKEFKYKVEAGKGQTNIVSELKNSADTAEKKRQIMENAHKSIGAYTEEEIERQRVLAKEAKQAWMAAGGELSSTTKTKGEDIEKSRLNLLKELRSQYEDLLKYYTQEEAAQKVYKNNKEEILRLGLQVNEMTKYELSEYLKLLHTLKQTPDVLKEISKTETLIDVKIKEDSIKKAKDKIDDLFSGYELGVEIESQGLDKGLFGNMFDIYIPDRNELKREFEGLEDEYKDKGTEIEKIYEEGKKKMQETDKKYFQGLIKQYASVSASTQIERLKIEKEFSSLNSYILKSLTEKKINQVQYDKLIEQITKGYKSALSKIDWKEFQASADFAKAFGDTDNTSTQTLERVLVQMKKHLSNAITSGDVTNAKEYVAQIEKLYNTLLDRKDPFVELKDALKAYNKALEDVNDKTKKSPDKFDNFVKAQNRLSKAVDKATPIVEEFGNNMADVLGQTFGDKIGDQVKQILNLNNALVKAVKTLKLGDNAIQKFGEIGDKTDKAIEKIDDASTKSVAAIGEAVTDTSKAVTATSATAAKAISVVEKASVILAVISAVLQVAQSIMDIDSEYQEQRRDMMNDIIKSQIEYNKVLLETKLLHEDIFGSNPFGNILSDIRTANEALDDYFIKTSEMQTKWVDSPISRLMYKMASQGIFSWINPDDVKAKSIENLRYITDFGKKGFLGIGRKSSKTQDLQQWVRKNFGTELFGEDGIVNLDIANELLSTHADRLTDQTKNTLESLVMYAEKIKEVEDNITSWATDIFGDLSTNLSDALVESFRNGEDAADDFKTHVSSILETLGQQMLQSMLYENVFKTYQGDLEKLTKKYALGNMTQEQYQDGLAKLTADIMNSSTSFINVGEDFLQSLKDAAAKYGVDIYSPTNDGELSGLQKGIQGVTEQTAQALEALLNSMRFFVADSNKQLQALYKAFTSLDENYNPILGELRVQTEQIRSINKLLNNVSKAGHSKGGYGLKVFMD